MDNLADSPTNAVIVAKFEIELQKELKSIGLNEEILPKTTRTKNK